MQLVIEGQSALANDKLSFTLMTVVQQFNKV